MVKISVDSQDEGYAYHEEARRIKLLLAELLAKWTTDIFRTDLDRSILKQVMDVLTFEVVTQEEINLLIYSFKGNPTLNEKYLKPVLELYKGSLLGALHRCKDRHIEMRQMHEVAEKAMQTGARGVSLTEVMPNSHLIRG